MKFIASIGNLVEAAREAARLIAQYISKVAGVVALGVLAACSLPKSKPPGISTTAFLVDASGSTGSQDRCGEVGSKVDALVTQSQGGVLDILVLATGDRPSLEPSVLVRWRRLQPADRMYGDQESEARERSEFVASLVQECRTGIKATGSSPVFLGVRRAAEALLAHCDELGRKGELCTAKPLLEVHSDLRENEDQALVARLYPGNRRKASTPPLPTIDVHELEVVACGYVGYLGAADQVDVVAVWREVLGREATFNPVCDAPKGAPAARQAGE